MEYERKPARQGLEDRVEDDTQPAQLTTDVVHRSGCITHPDTAGELEAASASLCDPGPSDSYLLAMWLGSRLRCPPVTPRFEAETVPSATAVGVCVWESRLSNHSGGFCRPAYKPERHIGRTHARTRARIRLQMRQAFRLAWTMNEARLLGAMTVSLTPRFILL